MNNDEGYQHMQSYISFLFCFHQFCKAIQQLRWKKCAWCIRCETCSQGFLDEWYVTPPCPIARHPVCAARRCRVMKSPVAKRSSDRWTCLLSLSCLHDRTLPLLTWMFQRNLLNKTPIAIIVIITCKLWCIYS